MSAPGPKSIRVGLIGGSGLGAALGATTDGKRHEINTPFGLPSAAIVETEWAGLPVFFLPRHGPGHTLNPSQIPYRANLFALKTLGVTHILASGAVGSLREEFRPRDVVIVDQVIDKTHRRTNTFYDRAAVHVEFAEPFCPVLRRMLAEGSDFGIQGSGVSAATPASAALSSLNPEPRPLNPHAIHAQGCYVCMEGPAFSSRAESLMHRQWGGGVVGMTALPEAKLAKEAEMAYALVALVTDYDCWKPPAPGAGHDSAVLLKEIIGHLNAATQNAIELLRNTVERMATRQDELLQSPALRALELAIWSDKKAIEPAEVKRLHTLWGRYF